MTTANMANNSFKFSDDQIDVEVYSIVLFTGEILPVNRTVVALWCNNRVGQFKTDVTPAILLICGKANCMLWNSNFTKNGERV